MRKKMFKRVIGAAMAAALGVGSLTACSSGSAPANNAAAEAGGDTSGTTAQATAADNKKSGDKKVIRICWWGNQARNDGTVKALDLYTAENPNVEFEVEFTDWGNYWDKLATQAAGGNLPDIIQMDYAYLKQYQEQGLLEGLNQYITSGTFDTSSISDSVMDGGKISDEIWAVCAGMNCKALLVNKDILAEAGVTLSQQPTWDEFQEAAKTIYDKTGKQFVIPSNDEQSMLFFARAKGQTMFNEAGDGLGMPDDSAALRYFQFLQDTLDNGSHVSPEIMAESSTNQQSLFAAGKVWCELTNSNMIINTLQQCENPVNYDILIYPNEADAVQQNVFIKPSQFWSLTSTSQNKEDAVKVIDFLTNSVEANKILLGERGVPISSEVSDAIKGDLTADSAKVTEYVEAVAPLAAPIDPPFPGASAEVGKLISDLADKVRYQEISPEDAAAEFYEESVKILQKGAQS